jgi:effector-binding domain-containing protein
MPISYYEPAGESEFDVSAGFPVDSPIDGDGQVTGLEIPAGEVAFTTHMGAYAELSQAYEAVMAWMNANGRESSEECVMWEEYWSPPETPPEETRTDIYWPLKPA